MITTQPSQPISRSLIADVSVVAFLSAVLYGLVQVARHWEAPIQPQTEIDLSLAVLPIYTFFSLLRGFAAYGLSLLFTLTYGYAAVNRPGADRIMIPLLDILQSIPVLGFLPGAVLALVALFPRSNAGLEIASILMIFCGQVWNMTFSFYQSLKTIPAELKQAADIYQFNWWQRFVRLELPASAVGLAWNSMMSMAGGWFFLMVCEAFTLGAHDFRLPGLGAYMSVAISRHNIPAIISGIIAMILMIILVDALIWRPVISWTQKFRMEETASPRVQESWTLNWMKRSTLLQVVLPRFVDRINERFSARTKKEAEITPSESKGPIRAAAVFTLLVTVLSGGATLWAAWKLFQLLAHLHLSDWGRICAGVILTFLRVVAAVILGSLWTIPAGIWIGRSELWRRRLQPFVQVAASFPAPMLYPIILIVLREMGWGLSVGSIFLMLLGTQWYILFNVIAGVSTIPEDLRQAAQAYQFTPIQRWKIMWWPAIFPYLVTGWLTSAGGAWNASIVAEYVFLGDQLFIAPGLGSLISLAATQGHYDLLAAGIFMMAITVVLISRFVWKPLYRLAESRYAYDR